jgi:hypothetical protein
MPLRRQFGEPNSSCMSASGLKSWLVTCRSICTRTTRRPSMTFPPFCVLYIRISTRSNCGSIHCRQHRRRKRKARAKRRDGGRQPAILAQVRIRRIPRMAKYDPAQWSLDARCSIFPASSDIEASPSLHRSPLSRSFKRFDSKGSASPLVSKQTSCKKRQIFAPSTSLVSQYPLVEGTTSSKS